MGWNNGVLHTGEKIDPQDMMNMGGLSKKMPVTFWTFLIGGFALSGVPVGDCRFLVERCDPGPGVQWRLSAGFRYAGIGSIVDGFLYHASDHTDIFGKPRTK